MQGIFSNVLGCSLSASLVILAVLVLRHLLGKAPRKYICLLWSVVLVRLLWLGPIELPFSLLSWEVHEIPSAMAAPWDVDLGDTLDEAGLALLSTVVGADTILVRTAADKLEEIGIGQYWFAFFSWVWLIGLGVMLIRAILSHTWLKGRLDAAVKIEENVWELPGLETAFVIGLGGGKIYLPAGLDPERRALILQHERTHIARFDPLWKLLGFIALAVHWFNPLCRYAYRIAVRDLEIACDQAVAGNLDRKTKGDYAQAILDLASPGRPADAPVAFGEGDTAHRVREILDWRQPGKMAALLALAGVLGSALLLMGSRIDHPSLLGVQLEPVSQTVLIAYPGHSGIENVPLLRMDPDGTLYHMPEVYTILEGTAHTDGTDWTLLGQTESYPLTWRELKDYISKYRLEKLSVSDRTSLRRICDARILHPGPGTTQFFLVIRTKDGKIYVTAGYEDLGERYEGASDDTSIYWIARMGIAE